MDASLGTHGERGADANSATQPRFGGAGSDFGEPEQGARIAPELASDRVGLGACSARTTVDSQSRRAALRNCPARLSRHGRLSARQAGVLGKRRYEIVMHGTGVEP